MYQKQSAEWTKHIDFTILDILCLQAAFFIAYIVRHGDSYTQNMPYVQLAFVCALIDFFVVIAFSSFKGVIKRGYYREFMACIKHVFLFGMLMTLYLYITKEGAYYSRIFFFVMLPTYFALTYVVRVLWKTALKKTGFGKAKRALLIIAKSSELAEIVREFIVDAYNGYSDVRAATIDVQLAEKNIAGVPVVAGNENIMEYLKREWVDEVLLALPIDEEYPYDLYHNLKEMGITVHMVIAKNHDMSENRQQVEHIGQFTVMTTSLNYASKWELAMKRLLDIVGGLTGCLFTVLLIIVLGPIIKIASPGPIFFSQYRVGRNGKKFKIYKFRSMYVDAEEHKKELIAQSNHTDGMMFKMDFDPRIIGNKVTADGKQKTGVGQFIRKTSLDEFPQFWNVLKGDMSLVGTRPPTLDEWGKYEAHHKARMAFRPGLTGMWQVSGRSKITDFEDVVGLDTKYIDEWNIGLDIKILLKTIGVLIKNDGAM